MRHLRSGVALLLLMLAGCHGSVPETVTFAQFTDTHIFDEKSGTDTAELMRNSADDRDALRWAIDTMNRFSASNSVDFVVYVGDWGLENVDYTESGCTTLPASVAPERLHPFPWTSAVKEVAQQIGRLKVRRVFLLPGNNDLVREKAVDISRYTCFVAKLQGELASTNSHVQIDALEATASVQIKGVHFAGLNSASFKDVKNYKDDQGADICAQPTPHVACPAMQFDALAKLPRPLVLFTHVPDLLDPQSKTSAWLALDGQLRARWVKMACAADILAIFAGHFHSSDRSLYGNTSSTKGLAVPDAGCIQVKTIVAPPLAIKYQADKAPRDRARGVLLATVTLSSAKPHTPEWLP